MKRLVGKRGDISINYVIIAAIALIVLIIIVLFFTGGIKRIFEGIGETTDVSENQKALWRSQCELWCTLKDRASFDGNFFQDQYSCASLNVPCTFEESAGSGQCGFKDKSAEASTCAGFSVSNCASPCEVTSDNKCKLLSAYCDETSKALCESKSQCRWS